MFELSDIQSIIFQGFRRESRAMYALLQFNSGKLNQAKKWLSSELDNVSISDESQYGRAAPGDNYRLIIAFSYPGLQKLGFGEDNVYRTQGFGPAFLLGMDARSTILRDTPNNWVWGTKDRIADVLVIYFLKDEHFDVGWGSFSQNIKKHGMYCFHTVEGYLNENKTEHFGFRDGISQPGIEGYHSLAADPNNTCKAGEFILGQINERGAYPDSPNIHLTDDQKEIPKFVKRFSSLKQLPF